MVVSATNLRATLAVATIATTICLAVVMVVAAAETGGTSPSSGPRAQAVNTVPTFISRMMNPFAYGACGITLADVNADGWVDAVAAFANANSVIWHENDGGQPPMFTPHVVTAGLAYPTSVATADINGDGYLDILSGSHNDERVAWYESDGSVTTNLSLGQTISAPTGWVREINVAVADDGVVTVFAASLNSFYVYVASITTMTSPSFLRINVANLGVARAAVGGDLNGDGFVDVVTGSDPELAWHQSDGGYPPSFTTRVIIKPFTFILSVQVADMNGDGFLDIVSANGDGTLAWFESSGEDPPSFTARKVGAAPAGATSMHVVDMNGDGFLDIVCSHLVKNSIVWFENDGSVPQPTFAQHVVTTSASAVCRVVAGDLNRDGVLDIISGNAGDRTISWYESQLCPAGQVCTTRTVHNS
jgi:hypothetical protein